MEMNETTSESGVQPAVVVPSPQELQVRQWAMFLHLAQFTGYVIPFAGFITPIVIWQIKKTEMPPLDAHGKVVLNWMISQFIYIMVGLALSFIVIGIPILFVAIILGVVFPIIGGIKANSGEVWKYPLSIPFLK